MTEAPDFDQLAIKLHDSTRAAIAEALRLVWNARGAADIAKVDALLGERGLANAANLDHALRSLDR